MKESAQAAFSVVKANAEHLKIDAEQFAKCDYHVHVPVGAVPKDGPSAGVAGELKVCGTFFESFIGSLTS